MGWSGLAVVVAPCIWFSVALNKIELNRIEIEYYR